MDLFALVMMVGFASEDSHGAVYLLGEEKTYHLVAEGHLGEREFGVGSVVDFLRETVRSADHEYHPLLPSEHPLLDEIRKSA